MMNNKDKQGQQEQYVMGIVVEALPNALFRVKVENSDKKDDEPILTYLSGKMRIHRIRVLVGDKVKIQTDSYGGRGRIVQRLLK